MSERFFKIQQDPKAWADARKICHVVVTHDPWQHTHFQVGKLTVKGRRVWGAPTPAWKKEVIYYNTAAYPLAATLNKIVIHHTNNSNTVLQNENKQRLKGYAALGYHFFIDQRGQVFEGRPLEVMGSHAGTGLVSGPLSDPDWGAIGIVLQGDYHHEDDYFFNSEAPKKQLETLEKLVVALKDRYAINQLLMHREIVRGGTPTVCPGDHMVPHVEALRKKLKMKGTE